MRKSFLLTKIIIFFGLFTIHTYWLNAADLFIKAGYIFIKEQSLFNASIGLDFNLAKKIHLDLEFSLIPEANNSDQYDVGASWIMHSMLFVRFTQYNNIKKTSNLYFGGGFGIAIESIKETYDGYYNGYLVFAFSVGNEIRFSKYKLIFPDFKFVTYNFWVLSMWLQGGIKW